MRKRRSACRNKSLGSQRVLGNRCDERPPATLRWLCCDPRFAAESISKEGGYSVSYSQYCDARETPGSHAYRVRRWRALTSMRFGGLAIDTVVCLTLPKWETVSGQFGGYWGGFLQFDQPSSSRRSVWRPRSRRLRACRDSHGAGAPDVRRFATGERKYGSGACSRGKARPSGQCCPRTQHLGLFPPVCRRLRGHPRDRTPLWGHWRKNLG